MTDASYAQLLEDLRRDLQLNPSTDLLPFAVASAQNQPWKVDVGTGTVTFTAASNSPAVAVSHRLGRVPIFVAAFETAGNGVWFTQSGLATAIQVSFIGWFYTASTGTFPFNWVAIG